MFSASPFVTVLSVIIFLFVTTMVAQRVVFPRLPGTDVAKFPLVTVIAQMLAYFAVFAFMAMLAKRSGAPSFWPAVRWNWPVSWPLFLAGGAVMAFALQGLAHVLPMPKELPIDRFFQTPLKPGHCHCLGSPWRRCSKSSSSVGFFILSW